MLTGRQLREARELSDLTPSKLANRTKLVTTTTINKAEADDRHLPIAGTHLRVIREKLERLGVEFTADGPRLRNDGSLMRSFHTNAGTKL